MHRNQEHTLFYEQAYAPQDVSTDALNGRWRALGAISKADHVISLCARGGISPASTLEVGCGDGALLSELHARGFGGRLEGVDVARAAIKRACSRPGIHAVASYDGMRLPCDESAFDLGIASHVLEHVLEPGALLTEIARVCESVVIEVPLEDNLSARRPSRGESFKQLGHLHRLSRGRVRKLASRAGLRIVSETEDALPLSAQRFFATSPASTLAAAGKWAFRSSLHRLAPHLARRLFTVHYACLCVHHEARLTRPSRRQAPGAEESDPLAGRAAPDSSSESTLPMRSSGTAEGSASF